MSRTYRKSYMDRFATREIYLSDNRWCNRGGKNDVDQVDPWYDHKNRDGRLKLTNRHKLFKDANKKNIRTQNRRAIKRYMQYADDDIIFFEDKDGKPFIWDFY